MPTQLLSPEDLDWYDAEDVATDRRIADVIRRTARCERFLEAIDWRFMRRSDFHAACDRLAALDDEYHELLHSNALYQRLYTLHDSDPIDDDCDGLDSRIPEPDQSSLDDTARAELQAELVRTRRSIPAAWQAVHRAEYLWGLVDWSLVTAADRAAADTARERLQGDLADLYLYEYRLDEQLVLWFVD